MGNLDPKNAANPTNGIFFFTHHGYVPDPILLTLMNDTYPGWWATKEKIELKTKFVDSTDMAERKQIWAKLQSLIYAQVPAIKTGENYSYNIASQNVTGVSTKVLIWPSFWNVSLKK